MNTQINRKQFIKYLGTAFAGSLVVGPWIAPNRAAARSKKNFEPSGTSTLMRNLRHVTVADHSGYFLGWPANNGLWSWDVSKEILVGFTEGPWNEDGGFHRIGHPQVSKLARSEDGGKTWSVESPDNFVGSEVEPSPSPGGINFGHSGFGLRIAATGYHGTDDPVGRFFITYNRGQTWSGPYRFKGLNDDPHLSGMEITSRTCYLVNGSESIQIIMTARNPRLEHASRLDKPFLVESHDGGRSFEFISWIVPWTDNYRAAMPSIVRTRDGKLVVALRRRNPRDILQTCWIDCWISENNGRNWSFLSRVGETGVHNGNPPALALLKDGRIACAYANRDHREMRLRYSVDQGANWESELVIQKSTVSEDMGYPQMFQNHMGEMVCIYYISRKESPQHYIEAAVWSV